MSAIDDLAREMTSDIGKESRVAGEGSASRQSGPARWFHDLPLRRKIGVVFGLFVAAFAAISILFGFGLSQLYERNLANNDIAMAVQGSSDLHGAIGELRYHAQLYTFTRDEDALVKQRSVYAAAQDQLAGLRQPILSHAPAIEPRWIEMQGAITSYNENVEELRDSIRRTGNSPASVAIAHRLGKRGNALFEAAGLLNEDLETAADRIGTANFTYFSKFAGMIVGAVIAGVLILFAAASLVARGFSTKVSEITAGMTKLASGERDFDIAGADRKDEIGEMLRAMAVMKRGSERLEQWAKERAGKAAADLEEQERAQAEKRAVLSQLANEFEQTVGDVVGGVAAASTQLKHTAGSMAGAAEDTTRQAHEVSRYMNDANSGANAAAAATDEFSVSISEISRQAASSADLAREANVAAGKADMTISTLSDSAAEIGQIVDLIQSIAQRTNLLALNASIEAARGGEAGRGFAVVASEVKELANQTSHATEQVAGKIRAIQESTGASVAALRQISSQVSELEVTATSIASAVDQQSVAGQDLARSIDMAARSTNAVSSHIDDVRELSQTTGAAASQVLASSTELEFQAEELRRQVDGFLAKVRAG